MAARSSPREAGNSSAWMLERGLPERFVAGSASSVGWILPIVLVITATVFFCLYLATATIGDLQCAAALAITAAPFVVAAADAPGRLLHPMSVVGFTMVLGIAGQTIYLTHGAALLPELLSGLSPEILNRGLLVVAAGVACLCLGYLVARPAPGAQRPGRIFLWAIRRGFAEPSPRRVFWMSAGLCLISILAFAAYAPKVGIHGPADLLTSRKRFAQVEGKVVVYGYYRFVIGLCGIGFLLSVYTLTRNRISWRSGLGAMAVLAIVLTAAFTVVTSSRTELFVIAATGAFIMIALRRREPSVGMIVGVMVIALACVTLLGGLRAENSGRATSVGASNRAEAIVENAVGSRDWMDIGPISVVTERVPSAYPYQYGKSLISILWEPIPRTIWPDKPPVRFAPEYSPPVYGFRVSERISGDPPGIIGELWINGGLVAVAAGMLLLGFVIKRIERWYRLVEATSGLSAIFYGVVVTAACLQLPIADFTGVLTTALENLAILAVMLWACRDRGRPYGIAVPYQEVST